MLSFRTLGFQQFSIAYMSASDICKFVDGVEWNAMSNILWLFPVKTFSPSDISRSAIYVTWVVGRVYGQYQSRGKRIRRRLVVLKCLVGIRSSCRSLTRSRIGFVNYAIQKLKSTWCSLSGIYLNMTALACSKSEMISTEEDGSKSLNGTQNFFSADQVRTVIEAAQTSRAVQITITS